MTRIFSMLIAGFAAVWLLAGFATSASAHAHHRAGCNCGPTAPSTYYKTVHPAKSYTRYRDVSVVHNVHRIHRVVNVTRVQPIIHIHEVTRVHHHTVVTTRNAYEHVVQRLAPMQYVTHSTEHYYDCHCGY